MSAERLADKRRGRRRVGISMLLLKSLRRHRPLHRLVRRQIRGRWYHGPVAMNSSLEQMDRAWKFWLVRAWVLVAMLIYAVLALSDGGKVDWGVPWVPNKEVGTGWFVFVTTATILTWADGWILVPWLSRRKRTSKADASRTRFEYSAFGRFLVRAAVIHGASLWGLLLSFKTHDARYALVSVGISSVMVLLLPKPRHLTVSAANADNGAPPFLAP